MQEILERAAKIRLVSFDVDGVLTDGKLFFDEQGREYKSFHVCDGLGIKLLRSTGVEVAVISGRLGESVQRRMEGLGIVHVFLGQKHKLAVLQSLCDTLGLKNEQIAHVGDDLPDLPLMRRVGLAVAVADAHEAILPHVHWVTQRPGGSGAAREVCDLVLRAQGTYDAVIRSFF